MNRPLQTYQDTDTMSKSPVGLLLKVYDGGLQAFAGAKDAYARNDFQEGYRQLERARRFVVHLYTTLDFDKGGDVANRLGKLYVFIMNEIDLVEATKQVARIDSCAKVLKNIREGWAELNHKAGASGRPPVESTLELTEQTLEFTA